MNNDQIKKLADRLELLADKVKSDKRWERDWAIGNLQGLSEGLRLQVKEEEV